MSLDAKDRNRNVQDVKGVVTVCVVLILLFFVASIFQKILL